MEVIRNNEPCLLLNLSHRSGEDSFPALCILLCIPADVIPISALLRIQELLQLLRTEQGRSCKNKSFLVVRRTVTLTFGYVLNNVMKKKRLRSWSVSIHCWKIHVLMGCIAVPGCDSR